MRRSTILSLPLQLVFPDTTQLSNCNIRLIFLQKCLQHRQLQKQSLCLPWLPRAVQFALRHQGTLTEGGRVSTIDLHVLTRLAASVLKTKNFFTKQATLMRRSTVLSFPFQLVLPGVTQLSNCGIRILQFQFQFRIVQKHILGCELNLWNWNHSSTSRCRVIWSKTIWPTYIWSAQWPTHWSDAAMYCHLANTE